MGVSVALALIAVVVAAAQDRPPAPPRAIRLSGDVSLVSAPDSDQVEIRAENLRLRLVDADLEIRADRALLWGDRSLLELLRPRAGGDRTRNDPPADPLHVGPQIPPTPGRAPLPAPGHDDPETLVRAGLHELYAEGHVLVREGSGQLLFAERMHHHFIEQRGVIIESDVYRQTIFRGQPATLHVRAAALRQLGEKELHADGAQFTTCSYGHPHYHVETDLLRLADVSATVPPPPVDPAAPEGAVAPDRPWRVARIGAEGNALRVADTPILPLPDFSTTLEQGDTLPLKKVRAGRSTSYGTFVETLWGGSLDAPARSLEQSLALSRPLRLEWEADVDFYSRRGVGLGPALQWSVPKLIEGEIGGYWIRDQASEDTKTSYVIEHEDRGRAWLRDRYWLPDAWRLDTEVSYLSDEGFQPEFFEREFKEEKEPESYAHLVRQVDDHRLRFLYRNRLNDFQTQTDSLPRASFEQIGAPLLELPLPTFLETDGRPNWLVLTHATELGNLRSHPASDLGLSSEQVLRADTQFELSTTLPLGPIALRPFTAGRFSGWDRGATGEDALGRAAGIAGARAELMFHRNYDTWFPPLSIDGLRHVVLFDADYVNVYDVTRDPSELVQIDAVDQFDVFEVFLLAVRQRWQTHRGTSIETLAELDLELPLYPHAERDNPAAPRTDNVGRTAGPLRYDFIGRPGLEPRWLKSLALFADGEWNFHAQAFDETNQGFALQPDPEWTTLLSYRVTRDVARVITAEIDYRLTTKWSIAALEQYDLREDAGLEHRYELRRIGHDFTFAVSFERDPGDGNTSVAFVIYPSLFRRGRAEQSIAGGRSDRPGLDPRDF